MGGGWFWGNFIFQDVLFIEVQILCILYVNLMEYYIHFSDLILFKLPYFYAVLSLSLSQASDKKTRIFCYSIYSCIQLQVYGYVSCSFFYNRWKLFLHGWKHYSVCNILKINILPYLNKNKPFREEQNPIKLEVVSLQFFFSICEKKKKIKLHK